MDHRKSGLFRRSDCTTEIVNRPNTHPAQPCGRAFRYKVCGVVTMAYARMGGSEATIDDSHHWLMNLDAIIVGLGPYIAADGGSRYWGAAGCQGWPCLLPSTAKGALEGVRQDQIVLTVARTLR
jgi:hypothetical protein